MILRKINNGTYRLLKGLVLFLIGMFVVWVTYCIVTLPNVSHLGTKKRNPSITIISSEGTIIGSYGDVYGGIAKINDIPKDLFEAVTIIEDRRFYDHVGIDPIGLVRAVVVNIKKGYMAQGGSTITQQLAKMVFLTSEKTLTRKLKELFISFWLEYKFTKNEILTMYLNRAYFGSGLYGIKAASKRYFSKPPKDLSLYESAILAALLRAPSRLSPIRNSEASTKRAKLIINMLSSDKKISMDRGEKAINNLEIYKVRKYYNQNSARYFIDWVINQSPLGVDEKDPDLFVETTFDPNLQKKAHESLLTNLNKIDRNIQGAILIMDYRGAVKAMIGGKDWNVSQFNRATMAKRQPGSVFKTFVYLSAMEIGFSEEDLIEDTPLILGDWKPRNSNNKYEGLISLKSAFAKSSNVAAVRLSEKIGRKFIIKQVKRLGITSYIPNEPSMPLGTASISLIELTGAFVAIAGNGTAVIPYGIRKIKTRDKKIFG